MGTLLFLACVTDCSWRYFTISSPREEHPSPLLTSWVVGSSAAVKKQQNLLKRLWWDSIRSETRRERQIAWPSRRTSNRRSEPGRKRLSSRKLRGQLLVHPGPLLEVLLHLSVTGIPHCQLSSERRFSVSCGFGSDALPNVRAITGVDMCLLECSYQMHSLEFCSFHWFSYSRYK